MVTDVIMGIIYYTGALFITAWALATLLILFLIWKYRDKTFEDDIEWDVQENSAEELPYVRMNKHGK